MTKTTDYGVSKFNRTVQRFCRQTVPKKVCALQRAICLSALRGLVLKTPVRTGRARGGWQVQFASKADFIGALEKAAKQLDPAGSATIQRGLAKIAQMPPFSVTHIVNNVRYIVYLERGSSTSPSSESTPPLPLT